MKQLSSKIVKLLGQAFPHQNTFSNFTLGTTKSLNRNWILVVGSLQSCLFLLTPLKKN